MEAVRINKYLSEAGVCSRRGADRLIEEGRVSINGNHAFLGSVVNKEDEVRVDGNLVKAVTK